MEDSDLDSEEAKARRDAGGRESNIIDTEKFVLRGASSFGWSGFGKKSSNFDFDNPLSNPLGGGEGGEGGGGLEMKSLGLSPNVKSPKRKKQVKSLMSATISEEHAKTSFDSFGSFSGSGPPPPESPAPKQGGGMFAKLRSKPGSPKSFGGKGGRGSSGGGGGNHSFLKKESSLSANPHLWFEYVVAEGDNKGTSYYYQPKTGVTVWDRPEGAEDFIEVGKD